MLKTTSSMHAALTTMTMKTIMSYSWWWDCEEENDDDGAGDDHDDADDEGPDYDDDEEGDDVIHGEGNWRWLYWT